MKCIDGITLGSLIKGQTNHYRKFEYNDVSAEIGDCISIFNCDYENQLSVDHCHIAKVVEIRIVKVCGKDVVRVGVHYFIRPADLPEEISGDLHTDFDVVLDEEVELQPVEVEHIFNQCVVVEAGPGVNFDSIIGTGNDQTFICRYRLTKNQTLEPLYPATESGLNHRNTKMDRSCLQELGNSPRVVVKSLTEKEVKNLLTSPEKYAKSSRTRIPESSSRARKIFLLENTSASSDEENTSTSRKKNDVQSARRSNRKSTSRIDYKEFSSAEDSQLEEESVKTRSASKRQDVDDNMVPDANGPQKSQKRKNDELSDSDPASRRNARKSLRQTGLPPEETECTSKYISTRLKHILEKETSSERDSEQELKTPKSSQKKKTIVDQLTQSAKTKQGSDDEETCGDEEETSTRIATRTPKSSKKKQRNGDEEETSARVESGTPKSSKQKENRDNEEKTGTLIVTRTPKSSKKKQRNSDEEETSARVESGTPKPSKPKENRDNEEETGTLIGTPKSSKKKQRSDDEKESRSRKALRTRKASETKQDSNVEEETRSLRATRTPKSSKKGCDDAPVSRPRRSTATKVQSYAVMMETSGEDTDRGSERGRPSRSDRVARRSRRLASTEESTDDTTDENVARDKTTKLPDFTQTPRSSRRTKTPSAANREIEDVVDGESTPKKTPRKSDKTPKKCQTKTPRNLMPAMPERSNSIAEASSSLDVVRASLHVSAVPKSLPCREKEFNDIYNFVGGKISDSVGGCMFIGGLPGTGKTATVHAVVRRLEQDVAEGNLPPFKYIEVNGLRLTEPRQVFVRILQQLTGEKCTPQHAEEILAKKFTSRSGSKQAVLLLVDEVDMLRNRRQDVVYKLFDWPSNAYSKLVVLTIANTMDLPERLLMGRVTSRLGLTRLSFKSYDYKQLQEIVMARLQGTSCFNPDAVQLVARKVAAVSGDARRALDICRRATELLSGEHDSVTMTVVDNALKQMMNSAGVKSLKACSRMEQLFLQSVVAETERTGVAETNFVSVYRQMKSLCDFHGIKVPDSSESLDIASRLGSSRIILTDHGRADIMQTIVLNVSSDEIHYAFTKSVAA